MKDMNIVREKIKLDDGREIIIETGKLAKQANGSVVLKLDNTMLLATVVSSKEPREDVDFLPLSCEYREKFSAMGRFPGGFIKRESKPSDYEILIARLVDRALRPLFPDDYRSETFVTVELISGDKNTPPDALAGLAASAALMVSDIPFKGPISEVRVARIDGEFKINPHYDELERADINIIVGATMKDVTMVEGEMKEVQEADLVEAIKFAHEAIKKQCEAQIKLEEAAGKTQKRDYPKPEEDEELKQKVWNDLKDEVYKVAKSFIKNKHERNDAFEKVKNEFIEKLKEETGEGEVKEKLIDKYYHDLKKEVVREMILNEGVRLDGRKLDEVRPIWCEVDYLPSAHGSAIFTRGETQSLSTVTLGSKMDAQSIDGVVYQSEEKFILHYNFPPYSTGDARPMRGPSRREIGHGNLAHRALDFVIPKDENENPYTIRVVSDILESNGSSSMATVCAGTLALMDAGVQIKKPVSGIAMGLITDSATGRYAILSDILGDEDHLGDMDFKVTGTVDGLTATQMDIKIDGLSYEIMAKALEQAKQGRLHILNKMLEVIKEPRPQFKPHAPKIVRFDVPKDMIGTIIGPGGKMIQSIQQKTDTIIYIDTDFEDKGVVEIMGDDYEKVETARQMIKGLLAVPEVGEVYMGEVIAIKPYGAFVEILPGVSGLLHISEIDWSRIDKVEDVLHIGDKVKVKLLAIDDQGKLKLSRKVLIDKH
jgi:polyribonucleotide nucleotidyltransferase